MEEAKTMKQTNKQTKSAQVEKGNTHTPKKKKKKKKSKKKSAMLQSQRLRIFCVRSALALKSTRRGT